MGIGASKGQGSEATYEKRDAEIVSADKSNWPELAGAKLAESNGSGRKPHIVAQCVGPIKSSASNSMGEYLDSTKDSPRCDANARFVPAVRKPHIGAQSRGLKSEQCSSSTEDVHVVGVNARPEVRKPHLDNRNGGLMLRELMKMMQVLTKKLMESMLTYKSILFVKENKHRMEYNRKVHYWMMVHGS